MKWICSYLPGEKVKIDKGIVLSKPQANRLLGRLYCVLRSGNVVPRLKKIDTGHLGFCYWNGDIEVDPLQAPLQTFVHELLHICTGSTDEDYVVGLENALCYHLSMRQWRNLWIAIANAM